MTYLFWAQTIIWTVLAAYLVVLIKKSKKIEQDLDILNKDINRKNG